MSLDGGGFLVGLSEMAKDLETAMKQLGKCCLWIAWIHWMSMGVKNAIEKAIFDCFTDLSCHPNPAPLLHGHGSGMPRQKCDGYVVHQLHDWNWGPAPFGVHW